METTKVIEQESAVCKALNIPSIPKKMWDGEKSFKVGVAIVNLVDNRQAYAIATYNKETDEKPKITKVFSLEPFTDFSEIYIVPDYMNEDVENMDLDDESKKAAQMLIDEAKELESVDNDEQQVPQNEYFFDNITNDDQAAAFIKDYNKTNKIKGRVPKSHDGLVMRLSVIYSELNKKAKK